MISQETLATAVETGVISSLQAARLMELETAREAAGAEPVDDERLRFISGFGDIFVTLGLILFLSAGGYFLFTLGHAVALWAGLAVASWLLAEFFSRIRRMALPSIVLLLTFTLSIFSLILVLTGRASALLPRWGEVSSSDDVVSVLAAALVTAAAAFLHYRRFKVPITVAAGTGAVVCAGLALVVGLVPSAGRAMNAVILLAGLAVFALAMRYDLSDRLRVTRRTDIAFWLHLLAAPLIVHPLVGGMIGGVPLSDTGAALAIFAVFAVLGLVAVVIDRRALLVSGLLYAGFAFAALLKQSGLSYGVIAPATMLALGALVLILSAGWRPLRTVLLRLLPAGISARLSNATGSSAS